MQYYETALITTLGTDHQKIYGGGGGRWGMFEPQEFFFVIKYTECKYG